MRWSRLFADLESQVDGLVSAEMTAEVAERTRIEVSRSHLLDRLRAAVNHPIEVRLTGAGPVRGRLTGVGSDWLLMVEPSGTEAVVPTAALVHVVGMTATTAPAPDGELDRRLGLRHVLRGIARDRAPVRIGLTDGSTLGGTVDRVGADFLDLAEHPIGEPRRAAAISRRLALPVPALAVLRRS